MEHLAASLLLPNVSLAFRVNMCRRKSDVGELFWDRATVYHMDLMQELNSCIMARDSLASILLQILYTIQQLAHPLLF